MAKPGKSVYPIPFSISIPGQFTPSSSAGNITAIDAFTARVTLSEPIYVDDDVYATWSDIGLSSTQPNVGTTTDNIPGVVTNNNNRISMSFGHNGTRRDYIFPTALYSATDLVTQLNRFASTVPSGGVAVNDPPWTTSIFKPLFTSIVMPNNVLAIGVICQNITAGGVSPTDGITIDFTNPGANGLFDSIGPVFGFPTSGLGSSVNVPAGTNYIFQIFAPNPLPQVLISEYNIFLTMLHDSSFNGTRTQLLTSVHIGYANTATNAVNGTPYDIPVQSGIIRAFDVYFADQRGNKLPLSGFFFDTNISFYLHHGVSPKRYIQ